MNQTLFNLLRQKRNELAQLRGLPPYRVIPNKTLEQLAETQPTDIEQLKTISGFGPVKTTQYGHAFIQIIKEFSSAPSATSSSESEPFTPSSSQQASHTVLKTPSGQVYVFTVAEYIELVNQMLAPAQVIITGEVGQVDTRSRYTFFSLHDNQTDAVLSCFMWDWQLREQGIDLNPGSHVQLIGYGRIYPQRGSFSFEVKRIVIKGEGALKQAFEQLKSRLDHEGLFDTSTKRPLPSFPRHIGLLTSQFGEALHDFRSHLASFNLTVYNHHIAVEGVQSVDSILSGIKYLNQQYPHLDVIVLTRGGGSAESLQSFNHEAVARAIKSSKIPILTAIGHHQDQTIADLVSDFTCSTPTDAGKTLSQTWLDAHHQLDYSRQNLNSKLQKLISQLQNRLQHHQQNYIYAIHRQLTHSQTQLKNYIYTQSSFLTRLQNQLQNHQAISNSFAKVTALKIQSNKQQLRQYQTTQHSSIQKLLSQTNHQLHVLNKQIQSAHPHHRLAQGYSIVTNDQGQIITSTDRLFIGEKLTLQLHQGSATTEVKDLADS